MPFEIFHQFPKRNAECLFDQAAMPDVSGQLKRQSTARSAHAEVLVGRRALRQYVGDGGKAQHIVDDCRLAEQSCKCRNRWLGAHHATAALKTLQHRCLFTTDIGSGATPYLEMK